MSLAKSTPLYAKPTDYEDDTYAWCVEQAELLRLGRFAEADLPNIIEEIESLGREQKHALKSSYRLLIAHLLKWEFQSQLRSRSWTVTIARERANIDEREDDNPSLRPIAEMLVAKVYEHAVREAMGETGLSRSAFPLACPYALAELRDRDWLPD